MPLSGNKKVAYWLMSLGGGLVVGAAIGRILDYGLNHLSVDYTPIPWEHFQWGIKYGFLIGSIIAGLIIRLSKVKYQKIIILLALTGLFVLLSAILGAGIARITYLYGLWDTHHWRIVNITRHVMLIGAVWGRDVGVVTTFLLIPLSILIIDKPPK